MIASYLAQSLWRKARSGSDAYGQPTYATAVATKGRWLEKRRLVRNAQGEQVISEVTASLGPSDAIAVGDQLSSDGVTYLTVLAVSVSRGLGGAAALQRAYL
jgi:hypothetical protein